MLGRVKIEEFIQNPESTEAIEAGRIKISGPAASRYSIELVFNSKRRIQYSPYHSRSRYRIPSDIPGRGFRAARFGSAMWQLVWGLRQVNADPNPLRSSGIESNELPVFLDGLQI